MLLFVDNIFWLYSGWFRGVRPAGSHSLRCGIPAYSGNGHGSFAGAYHSTGVGSITSVQAVYVPLPMIFT